MNDTEKIQNKIEDSIFKMMAIENKIKFKLITHSDNISIIKTTFLTDIASLSNKIAWKNQGLSNQKWVPLINNGQKKPKGEWILKLILENKYLAAKKTLNKNKIIEILNVLANRPRNDYWVGFCIAVLIKQSITRIKNEQYYRYLIDYSNIHGVELEYDILRLILIQKCSGKLLVPIYNLKNIRVSTKLALISAQFKSSELQTMESLIDALQKKINDSKV